ncbi:hypothetical protein [Microbacterium sp. 10M-3C3]|jgi:hypothetical protein|uniref:hypothetical protein n=1 Tax=Microbacterium sp. 10M-3C3 TaxID=2483401 RepID=UPI000F64276D|nr:hypothetical protein [Microbacterium sp. 10M-3C3]
MTDGDTVAASERAALGWGLGLVPVTESGLGWDLSWDAAAGGARRLALVEGVSNLAQDLAVALLTPLGADPFDTGFGFAGLSVLTLDVPPALAEELLRLSIQATLVADARVREVTDVALERVKADDPSDRRRVVRAGVRTVISRDASVSVEGMSLT